jgi:alkylhydroperoxidase family enzyme
MRNGHTSPTFRFPGGTAVQRLLRVLINRRMAVEEQRVGVPLAYVRHIVATSLAAFTRYALFVPMSRYRRQLPADVFFVARLVATQRQDCGTCVQIIVNLARKAGVPRQIVEATLEGRIDALSPELQDVYRFTDAVLAATYDEDPLRVRLRQRYGDEGLIELAFAIATSQVFPLTKRALGYAVSCSKVAVEV